MLKTENTEVLGWVAAIRGMRNPLNSWAKCDSQFPAEGDPVLGENDLGLMRRLRSAGTADHRKYLRMITVYVDITAPLYWWKEFDTYKVGTVANSCSTMHKIQDHAFTAEDFSLEHLTASGPQDGEACDFAALMQSTIDGLNTARDLFLQTKEKKWWWQMIQLLPTSFNQRRTVLLNYEVLANIYRSRRNHKLDEWHTLCDWITALPYSELITGAPAAANENV